MPTEMTNQAAQTMPELPVPWQCETAMCPDLYTADKMHQYARDYAAALSQTAGVADGPDWRYAAVSALEYINAGDDESAASMLRSAIDLSSAAPAASGAHPDALPDGTLSKSTAKRVEVLAAASVSERARHILADAYRDAGFTGAVDDALSDTPSPHCAVTLRAIEQALTQQRGKPNGKLVGWWNGIMPDVTERSPYGPSVRWGADAENSGHDIPLYDGYNPIHYTTPQPSADAVRDGYYLASFKRSHDRGYVTWWMADNAGYTSDLNQAGIYTELTPGYHDSEYTVPVPVSFIDRLRVRRMVDVGDSDNRALWTAKDLRAALDDELEPLLSAASGEKGVG